MDALIPGLEFATVCTTPVIGHWKDGKLLDAGFGPEARAKLVDRYDLSLQQRKQSNMLTRIWRLLAGSSRGSNR